MLDKGASDVSGMLVREERACRKIFHVKQFSTGLLKKFVPPQQLRKKSLKMRVAAVKDFS